MSAANLILAGLAVLALAFYLWLAIDEFDEVRNKVAGIGDWFTGNVPSTGRHGLRPEHLRAVQR